MNHTTENHGPELAGPAGLGGRLLIASATLLACCLSVGAPQASSADAPLVLEKSWTIPDVPVGPYSDHLSIDLVGGRLFASPQAAKAIAVLDLRDGRVLKMMPVGNPHGLFFSPTLKRLFVTDGASGDVKVFSSEDYSLVKTIPLALGADALADDPHSQFIYVNNGGEHARMDHALISVVDTVRMEKVADIAIATRGDLEAAVVDSGKQLLYVNLFDDSAIAVVDLSKRQQVGTWKLPSGIHFNIGIAVDTAHSRLYVVSRDSEMHGSIIVLDTATGRPVATLPIGGWADGVFVDQKRQRIYVSAGVGQIESYTIEANDGYRRQATVDTAVLAKTSLYSSELDRLYVSVPHLGSTEAQIMVFKPAP
jgi:DNA-binding beta-propeller fold protein YncE